MTCLFSIQFSNTHIIFKAVAVCAVMPCNLVDRCQNFVTICCLHLYVTTVPPQDHNLINHYDKVKCFLPVLTAPGAWLPVFPQCWLTLRLLPCPSMGNMICLLYLDGFFFSLMPLHVQFNSIQFISCSVDPKGVVHMNFRGPPSWLWQKCNRLLRLGCP